MEIKGFPGGSAVKNPPEMQKTRIRFLGQEDLLEKEMETHSSILAWEILWTEEPGGLQSMGSKESDMLLLLSHFSCVQLLVSPWMVACEAPLSMGFSRQEYWSGLPLPSPGDLQDSGIEPGSLALQADSLPTEL